LSANLDHVDQFRLLSGITAFAKAVAAYLTGLAIASLVAAALYLVTTSFGY